MLENYRFVQLGNKIDIYQNDYCFMTVFDINPDNLGEIISLVKTMVEMRNKHYYISFNELKNVYGQKCQSSFIQGEKKRYSIDRWDNLRPVC